VEVRDRAGDVDVARELDRLAVVQRLQLRQLVGIRLDRVGDPDQGAPAVQRRHLPPGRAFGKRRACGSDCRVDLGRAALRQRGDHAAGRRIKRLETAPVGRHTEVLGREGARGIGELVGESDG